MNTFIFFSRPIFTPNKPKHALVVFAESLRVSGRLQAAYQGLKAHWRHQKNRRDGLIPDGSSNYPRIYAP